uniref:Uncharacterized protein n=1 Tax=Anguilla anguilla TaxID=7936 RepID=A0A0E9TAF1_ANGAN
MLLCLSFHYKWKHS